MASTYVNDLRLEEMATGDQSGSWGTTTNTNLELIGEALGYGTEGITTNADTHTTTVADGATDPGRAMYIEYTGTLDSACTITIAPNTLNRMHFIENGTSGSQNIIISQGSGANITIPPGDVKAVYLDGAGSGAAVVDAFASLNVVDLKVQDDLTVTDDATIGGTLGVTGIVTLTDDLIIGDGKTIGSASDVDAMTIASNGQVTFTQTLIGTALDISGDIDVDGTTNLDVVDIDGAVDMASTLQVDGVATFTGRDIHSGGITIANAGQIGSVGDTDAIAIASDGVVTLTQKLIGTELDISGNIDVDGTTNLDVVDIDGAVDMASTLGVTGVVTANAGVVVDNITIDGTEIDLSSGDLTVDVAGDIILDANGADIILKDDGTEFGRFTNSSTNFVIKSAVSDKDMNFLGNDGGSEITALLLDMSQAGRATFNEGIVAGTSSAGDFGLILNTASSDSVKLQVADTGTGGAAHATLAVSDGDLILSPTAERARLTDGGQLLVGTTSKTSADQGNCGALAVHGNTDASGAVCEVKNTGNPASNRDFIRFFNSSGAEAGSIEHNASESVAYNTSSDYRLKENIKPLANGLQRLLQLNPVQFDWKEDKTSSEGFIAHEVQEIFSDAISGEKDGEQTQGMDYGRITPLLVKAIQEQQEQIEGLKQEIQNLKGE